MKHLSFKEVQETIKKRNEKRNEAFDVILSGIYKHIDKCINTLRNVYFCFYQVPEFLLGYPLYDLNQCITYLKNELEKRGFEVKYIFPNVFIIGWFPKKQKLLETTPKPKNTTVNKKVPKKNLKL